MLKEQGWTPLPSNKHLLGYLPKKGHKYGRPEVLEDQQLFSGVFFSTYPYWDAIPRWSGGEKEAFKTLKRARLPAFWGRRWQIYSGRLTQTRN